jgi:hypothetical protein
MQLFFRAFPGFFRFRISFFQGKRKSGFLGQIPLKKPINLPMILLEIIRLRLPWRNKTMKNFFKNFAKKSDFAQRKNAASLYRIPEMIWMTDLKKASEWGAFLQKKGHSKKVPTF